VAVFVLVVIVMAVEVFVGLLAGSLALLSDAGHVATDALGLGMALAAMVAADRPDRRSHRTFGIYRLEILAALANAVLLGAVAIYVLVEAIRRFGDPPAVSTGPVLVAASIGLAVNVVGWFLLRDGASGSINLEGATMEVLADLWGSIGVIVAALLVGRFGWALADPIIASLIGVVILPRAWSLGKRAALVLVQAAPAHLDLDELDAAMREIEGVHDVHDLHVWTLTTSRDVASLHLMTSVSADPHAVLDRARQILIERFDIQHATVQVEPEDHVGCHEVGW
jgi:cobalt-zinc-cadmium efflux system protein